MHVDRLLKLAEHLESGKLGHKKFAFDRWNADKNGQPIHTAPERMRNKQTCGFMGCAIGECPIVWRKAWHFSSAFYSLLLNPKLRNETSNDPLGSACAWFDIGIAEANALFVAANERPWAKLMLTKKATAKQVAKGIRQFISWRLKKAGFHGIAV